MLQLANNAKTTLSFGIGTTDTAIQIPSADVDLFPALVLPGDFFMAALANNPTGGATLKTEYVKVTAVSGTTLTVERAQEGTTAQAFDAGDRFELRLTAGAVADLRGDVWGRPVSGGEVQTPTRVDDTSFTLPGDFTAEFETFRAVRAYQTADAQGHVVSSNYSGGVTTVVVEGMTLDTGLALVEYGMDVASAPKYTHAATADSASDADMLGGQLPAYYVNRAIATQAEAEAGTLDNVVMTPLKADQHFDRKLNGYSVSGRHDQFDGDLDTVLHNSCYNIGTATCTNFPTGMAGWGFVVTHVHSRYTLYATQIMYSMNAGNGRVWMRHRSNNVWGAWVAIGVNMEIATGGGFPVGAVMHTADRAVPDGFLYCNGAAISRTTFADLFGVIGTVFGTGNGTTTFNIPDLRSEFIRGAATTEAVGTVQSDEIKAHTHGMSNAPSGVNFKVLGDFSGHPNTVAQTASFGGTETRPQNVHLLPIIKY